MEEKIQFEDDDFLLVGKQSDIHSDSYYDSPSLGQKTWQLLKKETAFLFGAIGIALLLLMAVFGASIKEIPMHPNQENLPPRIPLLEEIGLFNGKQGDKNRYEQKELQNTYYWLGTNEQGQDVKNLSLVGVYTTLSRALVVTLFVVVLGSLYGLLFGYFTGKFSRFIHSIIQCLNEIPKSIVILGLLVLFPSQPRYFIFATCIAGFLFVSTRIQTKVNIIKEQDFVLYHKAIGGTHSSLMVREILPNLWMDICKTAILIFGVTIFTEVFLTFLGFDIFINQTTLGAMIATNNNVTIQSPYAFIFGSTLLILVWISSYGVYAGIDKVMKKMEEDAYE